MALVLALAAAAPASAHRRDEYLQAARLGIEPDRVQIELDLTPGMSVADAVLAEIDVDRNGSISRDEAQAYVARVRSAINLDVDGLPLALDVLDSAFPTVDAMRKGEGTIRIAMAAVVPPLTAGLHHVTCRNTHRRDIGAYLSNALVPVSDRVAVTTQERDAEQRDLRVEYMLGPAPAGRLGRWLTPSIVAALTLLAVVSRRHTSGGYAARLSRISRQTRRHSLQTVAGPVTSDRSALARLLQKLQR